MSPRPPDAVGAQHLGEMVSAYVDRRLPPPLQQACDRHLVACAVCREAAAAERRLLGSLRGAVMPGPPGDLQSSLLQLAAQARAEQPEQPHGAPAPLVVVPLHTPALHRSPVRAALLAGLAAGASAAAAWSIGVAAPAAAPEAPIQPAAPSGNSTVGGVAGGAGFAQAVSAVRLSPSPGASLRSTPTSMTRPAGGSAESRHD